MSLCNRHLTYFFQKAATHKCTSVGVWMSRCAHSVATETRRTAGPVNTLREIAQLTNSGFVMPCYSLLCCVCADVSVRCHLECVCPCVYSSSWRACALNSESWNLEDVARRPRQAPICRHCHGYCLKDFAINLFPFSQVQRVTQLHLARFVWCKHATLSQHGGWC